MPQIPPAPSCRCCGSSHTFHRGRKFGHFLKRDFDYFECCDCRFIFVDPFPGYQVYDDAYYRGHGADPFIDYEAEYRDYARTSRMMEFEDLARIADRYFARHPGGEPIAWLDFGCGAGGLMKYLSTRKIGTAAGGRRPVRVAGHDVGSYAERLRIDGLAILDSAALSAQPGSCYDAISLIEVIEHVQYPAEVMATIARLLKPGGLLLITTGNMAGPIPRRLGLNYAYCLPEIHVGLFNPFSLQRLFQRHQLTPYFVRYEGVVSFKVIRTLRRPILQRLARIILSLGPFVRLIDLLYGVSAMPCAVRDSTPNLPENQPISRTA